MARDGKADEKKPESAETQEACPFKEEIKALIKVIDELKSAVTKLTAAIRTSPLFNNNPPATAAPATTAPAPLAPSPRG